MVGSPEVSRIALFRCSNGCHAGAGGERVHWSAEALERELLARRQSPPDLQGAFSFIFSIAIGQADSAELLALHHAGLAVAAAMDAIAAATGDLPYHGRHHAVDATLAMGLLCCEAAKQNLISRMLVAVGIVAMVGHDMHHDGSAPGDGAMERRSQAAMATIVAGAGVKGEAFTAIGTVILATQPAMAAANAAKLEGKLPPSPGGPAQDMLNKLANEADLCGSMLPRLGPDLSLALAEEWRELGDPALLGVGTATARLAFLRSIPALSGPATALGLQRAQAACVAAYMRIGARYGTTVTAEAGCALLDSLPAGKAAELYGAALSFP